MAGQKPLTGQVVQEDINDLVPLLEEMLPVLQQFGIHLPVAYETIETIMMAGHVAIDTNMINILIWYKNKKGPKKWSDIVEALKSIGNNDLASRVPQDGDVPVKEDNYISLMLNTYHLKEIVVEWMQFGLQLGRPFYELEAINPQPTTQDYMGKLLSVWIRKQKEKATISALLEACEKAGNPALAEKLEENSVIKKIRCRKKQNNAEKPVNISVRKPDNMSARKPKKAADILREQLPNIVDAVTNAEDLADRIRAANLIASSTVEGILDEHKGRANRVRRFLTIIERNLTIDLPGIDPNATLNKFCEVLKKQNEQNLTIIAENMQEQLQ